MKNILSIALLVLSVLATPTFAANPLYDAGIRSLDKKFSYYDKEIKKAKYGDARWGKRVASKKTSVEKEIKKLEKKWPKEDFSNQWKKLETRTKAFELNSQSVAKPAVTKPKATNAKPKLFAKAKPKTPKVTTKRVDRLLQLSLKSVADKFKDYDNLLAEKKYGLNQWFAQLHNKKKIIITALKNLENKWPNENIKQYWDGLAARDKILSNNTYVFIDNIVKKRFAALDNTLKQSKYGQKKWDESLKGQTTSLNNAIKYFAKKWPVEAKAYNKQFQKRIAVIKGKNQAIAKAQQEKQKAIAKAKAPVVVAAKMVKKPAQQKVSILAKVKQDQADYVKNGKVEIWDNSTGDLKRSKGGSAYLTFSSDFGKNEKKQTSFSGQDFIYAHLNLSDKLTNLLPKDNAKGLSYYKVTIKASVKSSSLYAADKSQKNANKLQKVANFKLGYSTDKLAIAVVPEKAFFESVLNKYRTDDKFADTETEVKALRDLLSRNFSRQMSHLFKKLSVGEHQVEMEFQVLAKLNQSAYFELKNMKGTFLLTIDKESKEKYQNTFSMLSTLYKSYDSQHNIAVSGLDLDAEKKRLAKMTPRERERYNIAKISATGYMAAYGGERAEIKFSFGKLRTKNAYIDVVWNKGSCEKCEEGAASLVVRKTGSKTYKIPLGARVTLNGYTLIEKVSGKKHIRLYWQY